MSEITLQAGQVWVPTTGGTLKLTRQAQSADGSNSIGKGCNPNRYQAVDDRYLSSGVGPVKGRYSMRKQRILDR